MIKQFPSLLREKMEGIQVYSNKGFGPPKRSGGATIGKPFLHVFQRKKVFPDPFSQKSSKIHKKLLDIVQNHVFKVMAQGGSWGHNRENYVYMCLELWEKSFSHDPLHQKS
jgi:hypothetical protein